MNRQDDPIISEDHPLSDMFTLTIIPPILEDGAMQKKIKRFIETELEVVGEVIRLKDNDMRGFGAGNLLIIQIGNVIGWNEKEMGISRISLNIETSVTLNKTGLKTFPYVWSINTFLQGSTNSLSEDITLNALRKLLNEFIQNYKYSNQMQSKKPTFYIYD